MADKSAPRVLPKGLQRCSPCGTAFGLRMTLLLGVLSLLVFAFHQVISFAQDVVNQLREHGLRVELNSATETIGRKVREAQLEKVNYIVTIGDKEVEKKVVAVRSRAGKVTFDVKLANFIEQLRKEIRERG